MPMEIRQPKVPAVFPARRVRRPAAMAPARAAHAGPACGPVPRLWPRSPRPAWRWPWPQAGRCGRQAQLGDDRVNVQNLSLADSSTAAHFFNTSSSYGNGASLVKTPVQAGYATTPVLTFTSYAQFSADLAERRDQLPVQVGHV